MSRATLLHRESSSKSVKAIVEAAHRHRTLSRDYQLSIKGGNLHLEALKKGAAAPLQKQPSTDEGFESDIDSISLISTDDTFTPPPKNQETDSANGSAFGSDSDSDSPEKKTAREGGSQDPDQETFSLVNCICYTDIKFPDTLVFVILNETLVFRFEDLGELQLFYSNFSTVKAIANQRAYGGNSSNKFNLLQRTDANGVTHIEISRPQQLTELEDDYEPTSIISISAPESFRPVVKSVSSENLLDRPDGEMKKFWSSVENLLEPPPKQERRKRQKGPAPPPPVNQTNQNVLRGQFVRVNVQKSDQKPTHDSKFNFLRPKLTTFQQFKAIEPKPKSSTWTNSIPRLLKKSKPEARVFLPLAYRFIDTTLPPTNPPPPPTALYIPRYKPNPQRAPTNSQTISNRLFGMSSKLKEFSSVQSNCNLNSKYQHKDPKYSSLTNLHCADGTLKSVIKKDDVKKKNDKKVTFSAYNTVQVV